MRAIGISRPGGPDVLTPVERPVPEIGDNDILIAVAAAGVNRPDVLQRAGAYPPPPGASDLPGLEVAGTVSACGADVTRHAVGDTVAALVPGGGYAEFCRVDAGLTLVEAAALPETVFTVWHNVFQRGALQSGETLLVHGGSSGIGTTAIQLAKAHGATVIVTAGSAEKCAACRALGADHAINHREQDFVAAVREATDGRGADVILDMVGGDYIARNYQSAAQDGRIVQIAFLKEPVAEADFRNLMVKRLTHTGSTLRPRTDAFKRALAAEVEARVWPLVEDGRMRPQITATFALEEAAKAHALMESGTLIGKIVLTADAA